MKNERQLSHSNRAQNNHTQKNSIETRNIYTYTNHSMLLSYLLATTKHNQNLIGDEHTIIVFRG